MLFFGESLDFLDFLLDGAQDQRQQRVVLVGHASFRQAGKGGLEQLLLDLLSPLGVLQAVFQASKRGLDHVVQKALLVFRFEDCSLLENRESAISDMLLQADLLIHQENIDELALDVPVVLVEETVLKLSFS